MVFVRLYAMPGSVKSYVRHNPDDSYTIVINSRLNRETQRKCYRHELEHIGEDDLFSSGTADEIEKERHK